MARNPLDYYKTGKIILDVIKVIKPNPPICLPYPYPRLDKIAIIVKPVVKKIILKR